jgi:hypothetical protein
MGGPGYRLSAMADFQSAWMQRMSLEMRLLARAPAIIEWKSLLKLAYPFKKSPSSQLYVSEKNRECAGSFYTLAT